MKRTVYLDHAAATPMSDAVSVAMRPYQQELFYNPSALYLASKDVSAVIEKTRVSVAGHLGAKPTEVIFTAGGTEANNLAIAGVMDQYPDGEIVTSSVEHDSVLMPARRYKTNEISVKPDGRIDLEDLAKKITDKTLLVSVMYANNEIGTVQPIRQVAKVIEEVRKTREKLGNSLPIYFHTDACQAANYLDLHVSRLGVDLMTLNGGKIYGPKQSGVLFKSAGVQLKPQIVGGGQEYGLRSGTENVAGIVGFGAALDEAQAMRGEESRRLQELQKYFIEQIESQFKDAIITGSKEYRLPNNVHIQFEGQDNERLIMALDEAGIMCAAGSACSASKEEVSHVLHACNLSDEAAQSSLRFTLGRSTTKSDVDYTLKTLREILA